MRLTVAVVLAATGLSVALMSGVPDRAQAQAQAGKKVVTLTAAADVRIITSEANKWLADQNHNANVGAPAQLSVFSSDETKNYQRSLVRFDLSALPAGKAVKSATLTLYARFEAGQGNHGKATMSVYRVTQPWSETEATWNHRDWGLDHVPGGRDDNAWTTPGGDFVGTTGRPLVQPYATSNAQPAKENDPVAWDVTALAREWYGGKQVNRGLIVVSDPKNSLCFRSREYDDGANDPGHWAPRLEITLDAP
jgi:hypothetical protein